MNSGELGILIRCPECGDGFLHQPDSLLDGLKSSL
jgi:uncharacterized protein (DUF983 family)